MKLQVVVQHHPARAALVGPLLRRCPRGTVLIPDPDPDSAVRSPLRTYRACLEAVRQDATHLVVIQDDAMPVDRFSSRLRVAVEERPADVLVLFMPGAGAHRGAMLRAAHQGQRWTRVPRTWLPLVAVAWPVELAADFLRWMNGNGYADTNRHRADDGVAGRWAAKRRVTAWATVPSLVQHPDTSPSLIGRRHASGRNQARVAAVFTD